MALSVLSLKSRATWKLLRILARLRLWQRRRILVSVRARLSNFDRALGRLGLPNAAIASIRIICHARPAPVEILAAAFVGVLAMRGAEIAALQIVVDVARDRGSDSIEQTSSHYLHIVSSLYHTSTWNAADITVSWMATLSWFLPPYIWMFRRMPGRQYYIVYLIVGCVEKCAKAHAGRRVLQRPSSIRLIDHECRRIERLLMKSHRTILSLPRRSPRRSQVRRHCAHVAAALRNQMRQLDIDPEVALPELARILTTIGESYAAGRVGALLPDESLVGIEPLSKFWSTWRESVHMALMILVAMAALVGSAIVLPVLGVPNEVRPWVMLGCTVLAAVIVAGWNRVARVLETFPG